MPRVYVGIGSNLGARAQNIKSGLRLMRQRGFRIVEQSPVYETKPERMRTKRRFLNLVVAADTRLTPADCLASLQAVECALGRGRSTRNGPRTLDLDLLLYGNRILRRANLAVPHPRMHERVFVLRPLADIAPHLVHPLLRHRIVTLLEALPTSGIRTWKVR